MNEHAYRVTLTWTMILQGPHSDEEVLEAAKNSGFDTAAQEVKWIGVPSRAPIMPTGPDKP